MRRLAVLVVVGGAMGALALLLMRRARASSGVPMPAPASAPVHMAVGDSAPEVPIPGETDAAAS
jgi:hypothetical protein